MNQELLGAVSALVRRLVILAANDEEFRDGLRSLAGAVLEAAGADPGVRTAPEPPPAAEEEPPPAEGASAPPEAMPAPGRAGPPLPELLLGRSQPPEAEPRPQPPAPASAARAAIDDAELPAVAACCRLKAEGLRWAVARRRSIGEGADFRDEIAPKDREILDRAAELGCKLWMNTPDFDVPAEPAPMEDAAGWFEAMADAIDLIRRMLPDVEANREHLTPALELLAGAQSALRVAVERIGGPRDPDQFRVYGWLREVTAREHIYIPRHMRLEDPADPSLLPVFGRRIEAIEARFQDTRGRAKKRKSTFGRLRYHAKRIGEGDGDEHDWRKVAGAIDELLDEGFAPSSVEIREILLPIQDAGPGLDDPPQGLRLALREIDRYLAGRAPSPAETAVEPPTLEVAEAARLLEGKVVVLIGGSRRREAQEALEAALRVKELVWVETREHESIDRFEPIVTRPEVALVLLAIRWSSHSFGEVKRFCDRHDKPMVRLPTGYNPNQVAFQILEQCSGQLGGG